MSLETSKVGPPSVNDLVATVLDVKNNRRMENDLIDVAHAFKLNWFDRFHEGALHKAAEYGNLDLVKIFLDNKAKISLENEMEGKTALHGAKGKEVMEELLKHATNEEINRFDDFGWTPLHYAVESGDMETLELLVKKEVDINAVDEKDGITPLQLAANMGSCHVIEFLLKNGADTKFRDDQGKSAWDYAQDYLSRTDVSRVLGGKKYWKDTIQAQLRIN